MEFNSIFVTAVLGYNIGVTTNIAYACDMLPHSKSDPTSSHYTVPSGNSNTTITTTTPASSTPSSSISNIPAVLPPKILMIYSGVQYQGDLINYKYRHGYAFGELHIPKFNITANVPSQVVTVEKGSSLQFVIKGNPPSVPPAGLSVDAYNSKGKSIRVLDVTGNRNATFTVNLSSGKYILLAVATWLPEKNQEDVVGYAMYTYRINVIGVNNSNNNNIISNNIF